MKVKQWLLTLGLCTLTLANQAHAQYTAKLVKDINKGVTSSLTGTHLSQYSGVTDNGVVFLAQNDTGYYNLWITDGTSKGTQIVKEIDNGGNGIRTRWLYDAGERTYFLAQNSNNKGDVLWVTDGTSSGTYQVSDLTMYVGLSQLLLMGQLNDEVYFFADNGTHGWELYKTNGTKGNVQLLKDIYPGINSSLGASGQVRTHPFVLANNSLYFSANDGVHGNEVWRTDGTAQGTQMVVNAITDTEIGGYVSNISAANNSIYFDMNYNLRQHSWIVDTQSPNGRMLANNPSSFASRFSIAVGDDSLIFSARNNGTDGFGGTEDNPLGMEVWFKDNTVNPPTLLKDIWPGINDSLPNNYTRFNDSIYFIASEPYTGYQFWRTDGTVEGTQKVTSSTQNGFDSVVSMGSEFAIFDNRLFFTGRQNVTNDVELYSTDGTQAGTTLAADLNSKGSSYPHAFTQWNDKLFFIATDSRHGKELWVLEKEATDTGTDTGGTCRGKKCK